MVPNHDECASILRISNGSFYPRHFSKWFSEIGLDSLELRSIPIMTIASTALYAFNPNTIIADSILWSQSRFWSIWFMIAERLTDLVDFLSKFAWRNLNFFNRSASIMIVILVFDIILLFPVMGYLHWK